MVTIIQHCLTLPFGKYKDVPIDDINDLEYLKWFVEQVTIPRPLFNQVIDRLNVLEFIYL